MFISENCRDLLERLLQRDPAKRLSFDDFFRHPFVDLDHAPSPRCITHAVSLDTPVIKPILYCYGSLFTCDLERIGDESCHK